MSTRVRHQRRLRTAALACLGLAALSACGSNQQDVADQAVPEAASSAQAVAQPTPLLTLPANALPGTKLVTGAAHTFTVDPLAKASLSPEQALAALNKTGTVKPSESKGGAPQIVLGTLEGDTSETFRPVAATPVYRVYLLDAPVRPQPAETSKPLFCNWAAYVDASTGEEYLGSTDCTQAQTQLINEARLGGLRLPEKTGK